MLEALRRHHTGKQEKLQTSLSDNGRLCQAPSVGTLRCGCWAAHWGLWELGVWENGFKVNLMCFALEMRVSLWALTPAGLFVSSLEVWNHLQALQRCLVCHFLLVGNTEDLFVFKNCLGFVIHADLSPENAPLNFWALQAASTSYFS